MPNIINWYYPPHPLTSYKQTMPAPVFEACKDLAKWNLYYLSNPYLDMDLSKFNRLAQGDIIKYVKVLGLLHGSYKELPTLARDMLSPPKRLRQAVSMLELWQFESHVGEGWWEIFNARLAEAETRELMQAPIARNVIYANFGRKR